MSPATRPSPAVSSFFSALAGGDPEAVWVRRLARQIRIASSINCARDSKNAALGHGAPLPRPFERLGSLSVAAYRAFSRNSRSPRCRPWRVSGNGGKWFGAEKNAGTWHAVVLEQHPTTGSVIMHYLSGRAMTCAYHFGVGPWARAAANTTALPPRGASLCHPAPKSCR